MTTSSPTPQPNQQELREKIMNTVCGWLADLPLEITGLSMITHDHWQELYTNLEQLIQSAITEAKREIDPFDFVQPCEPECSPERHAYHQGQWDMATRMVLPGLAKLINEIAEDEPE